MTDPIAGTRAARHLAVQASQPLGRVSGQEPVARRAAVDIPGRLGRHRGWLVVPVLGTPWQDTISPERRGWRQLAAHLDGEEVFAVDYRICRRCRIGWVEQPHTEPQYQRCGLASAGLAALRREHPDLHWHTLGGHFTYSRAFWAVAGTDVSGGYQQRELCPRVTAG